VFAGVAPVALVEPCTSAFAASTPPVVPEVLVAPALPVLPLVIEPLWLPETLLSIASLVAQPARASPAASSMAVVMCFMVALLS
jgi:hypothetical protein